MLSLQGRDHGTSPHLDAVRFPGPRLQQHVGYHPVFHRNESAAPRRCAVPRILDRHSLRRATIQPNLVSIHGQVRVCNPSKVTSRVGSPWLKYNQETLQWLAPNIVSRARYRCHVPHHHRKHDATPVHVRTDRLPSRKTSLEPRAPIHSDTALGLGRSAPFHPVLCFD